MIAQDLRYTQKATGPNTIEYKIGQIFGEIKNKIHPVDAYFLHRTSVSMKILDSKSESLMLFSGYL